MMPAALCFGDPQYEPEGSGVNKTLTVPVRVQINSHPSGNKSLHVVRGDVSVTVDLTMQDCAVLAELLQSERAEII